MSTAGDHPYPRHIRGRIAGALTAAALLPLIVVGGGLYLFVAYRVGVPPRLHVAAALVFLTAGILIAAAVLAATGRLVALLDARRRSLQQLDRQLRRTSYLSASMELSIGYFQQIKETLISIDSIAAVLLEDHKAGDCDRLPADMDLIRSLAGRDRESIDRLLRYIQVEPPLIRDIDLHEVLDHLLKILEPGMAFRNIRAHRIYHPELPTVRSDRSKLRQVFQNIVLNAVTAVSRDGDIFFETAVGKAGVTLTIRDSGPGIAGQDLPRVFEPLWTTKADGAGLGLPISRNILEKLGGSIAVASPPGQGVAVTVTLPLRFRPPAVGT